MQLTKTLEVTPEELFAALAGVHHAGYRERHGQTS